MTDRYTDEARALLCQHTACEYCPMTHHGPFCPGQDGDVVARVAARLRELGEALANAADALGNAAGCRNAPQCDGVHDVEVTRISTEMRRAALARKEEQGG